MEERDLKGRFIAGREETHENKLKRISGMKSAWKDRDDYISDIKDIKFHNIWRSVVFSKKNKVCGHSENWNTFRGFYDEMFLSWERGKRLIRINKALPFSKDNCMWATDEESGNLRGNLVLINYNGESKTIKEWSCILNLNLNAVRCRYHRRAKYNHELSTDEIFFGVIRGVAREVKSAHELSYSKVRLKASKMISSYRMKDNRRRLETNITTDWMIENILNKSCVYCGTSDKIGCDRIDNSVGHVINNVVPCCVSCNTTRNDNYSFDEMIILGETIKLIKAKRQGYEKKI